MDQMLVAVLILAVSLFVTYLVIRKAVHDGIIDADDTRAEHERQKQLRDAVRRRQHPDAPPS